MELREDAARRLGLLGLVMAIVFTIFFSFYFGNMERALEAGTINLPTHIPVAFFATAILLSLAVFLLPRSGWITTESVLAIGLLYEVLIAFAVGFMSRIARVPAALEAVITQCLANEPKDRPQSASELADRLAALVLPAPWTQERANQHGLAVPANLWPRVWGQLPHLIVGLQPALLRYMRLP